MIENFTDQPDFTVFNNVETIQGYLKLHNNDGLTAINGFPLLTTVGDFDIFYNRNTSFTTISGFDKLKTTGFFHINGNISVTNIPTFNSLETINGSNSTGAFNLMNQKISNLSGFSSLIRIYGDLVIDNNNRFNICETTYNQFSNAVIPPNTIIIRPSFTTTSCS